MTIKPATSVSGRVVALQRPVPHVAKQRSLAPSRKGDVPVRAGFISSPSGRVVALQRPPPPAGQESALPPRYRHHPLSAPTPFPRWVGSLRCDDRGPRRTGIRFAAPLSPPPADSARPVSSVGRLVALRRPVPCEAAQQNLAPSRKGFGPAQAGFATSISGRGVALRRPPPQPFSTPVLAASASL